MSECYYQIDSFVVGDYEAFLNKTGEEYEINVIKNNYCPCCGHTNSSYAFGRLGIKNFDDKEELVKGFGYENKQVFRTIIDLIEERGVIEEDENRYEETT